jgi:hypothetical protein
MRLLTYLTLGYAGLLVLALAVALITIGTLLWRISFALAEVQIALTRVRDDTSHLDPQLRAVKEAVTSTAASLAAARNAAAHAVDLVSVIAGRAGLGISRP